MKAEVFVPVCCLLVCAVVFRAAADPQYSITNLGPASNDNAYSFALNNSGQATGEVEHPSGAAALLYSNGVMSELSFLGCGQGINASGNVTGYFTIAAGNYHAFLYSNGISTDLGSLGGTRTAGLAINDLNQVTGYSYTWGNATQRAFLYSEGKMIDLGTLGGSDSRAYAINNLGEVVGDARGVDGNQHAYLYSGGQMIDLGALNGNFNVATGLNDHGDVTGYFLPAPGTPMHAFLYSNQTMTDLGTFDGNEVFTYAINNSRQIVGIYRMPSGYTSPFLISGGRMYDLNILSAGQGPTSVRFLPPFTHRINDHGQIIAHGSIQGARTDVLLLTPNLHIDSIAKSSGDGQVRITGFGWTAQDYVVEAAPTLAGPFVKIGKVTTGDDGTFEFDDSAGVGARFYRVSYP
jgi:probable HAF family extracellular repeat protein